MAEFQIPEFLKNKSTDNLHAEMKEILPADIDLSQGSHNWNKTRPTALVLARVCQFIFPEVIKLISPEWSYGVFLDEHAKTRGMKRRSATVATGILSITGEAQTVIPAGSLFSTASVSEEPAVEYLTVEEVMISDAGTAEVAVECIKPGVIGNTMANTVIFSGNKLKGITSVTNPEEITGGTEEEIDESLIERLVEYDQTQGESFVGNPADYKRWALSVDGVGTAVVIEAQDDTGLVTLVITDANGDPATETLCDEVYNYIMRPDERGLRKAPINAYLRVTPPETIDIMIRATVELEEGHAMETVSEAFLTNLAAYLPEALEDREVKYTRVHAALSATEGVDDFSDLEIGIKENGTYGTKNIPVTITQLPIVAAEDLLLSEGTV